MRPLIAITLTVLSTFVLADTSRVEVIQVQSRPASDLIDSVRPLLGEKGSVSAYHDKLIVRGNAQDIALVRKLLKDLDHPARRLIIEVRQDGEGSQSSRDLSYGLNSGGVKLGSTLPRSEATLRFEDAKTRSRDAGLQQIQVLEGRAALIRTGQSVPVHQSGQGCGYDTGPSYQIGYRELSSGFYALPRIHGDQITVEIYQQSERPSGDGRFNHQQVSSVLRGNLGQWLSLGAVGSTDSIDSRGLGYQAATQRRQDRSIELRVIALD